MRIAPVGLLYNDDPEKLREMAYKSSQLTHSHYLAMEGAALEAYAIALALKKEKNFLEKLMKFIKVDLYKRKLESIERLRYKKEDRGRVVRELGKGIEALNSVPSAIYSFLVNSSFEETLIYAVGLGGDADTIGTMSGAIAGAWWGVEEIPSRWKLKLENREYIEELAEKLWDLYKRKKRN